MVLLLDECEQAMSHCPLLLRPLIAGLMVAVAASGCGFLYPTDPKPGVPPDHTDKISNALHKPGSEEPFTEQSGCTAYHCHHINLSGGWALAATADSEDEVPNRSPSCYQCHSLKWNERQPRSLEIHYPHNGIEWRLGGSQFVEWWGRTSDWTTIEVFRDNSLIDVLLNQTPSDGVFRIDTIPDNWGPGSRFRVKVTDSNGDGAFSEQFSIVLPKRDADQ